MQTLNVTSLGCISRTLEYLDELINMAQARGPLSAFGDHRKSVNLRAQSLRKALVLLDNENEKRIHEGGDS